MILLRPHGSFFKLTWQPDHAATTPHYILRRIQQFQNICSIARLPRPIMTTCTKEERITRKFQSIMDSQAPISNEIPPYPEVKSISTEPPTYYEKSQTDVEDVEAQSPVATQPPALAPLANASSTTPHIATAEHKREAKYHLVTILVCLLLFGGLLAAARIRGHNKTVEEKVSMADFSIYIGAMISLFLSMIYPCFALLLPDDSSPRGKFLLRLAAIVMVAFAAGTCNLWQYFLLWKKLGEKA
jgi:hypothetical protein